MINKRFLNFKTYNGFLAKKDEIPEDSIVFIQDKPCIWARGKEYICDGPSIASVENDTLTFKNGNDKTIFILQQNGGVLTIKDSEGNKISATYALKSQLSNVAFSGSYDDLTNTPDPIVVDKFLESGSENPIENNAVYIALQNKADNAVLAGYVQTSTYNAGMLGKQDTLVAGTGIQIYKDSITKENVIKSTLDTNVYEFVTEIPDVETADPNKIYILEVNNGDGTYRYEQYRLRDGQFVSFDVVIPEVKLDEYLKQSDADNLYQPKANNYVTSEDLASYATIQEHINPILSALNNYALKSYVDNSISSIQSDYATKDWVIETFVQKSQVYSPDINNWEIPEESETDSPTSGNGSSASNITIDRELDLTSLNPVQNNVVALAIKKLQDDKADKTNLLNYYTKTEVDSKLGSFNSSSYITGQEVAALIADKQDRLTAGRGISIVNNEISSTLDTEVYVFVTNQLPSPPNISANKIYVLETVETVNDEERRTYTQWRWSEDNNDWVELGSVTPEIDLSDYLTKNEASAVYAPKDNYATQVQLTKLREDAYNDLQQKGNYATVEYLEGVLSQNNYVTTSDLIPYALNQDVTNLRNFVNSTYVKIAQLYTPDDVLDEGWGVTTPTDPSDGSSGSSGESGSSNGSPKLVTLTESEYAQLVENNLVQQDVYYFTYEGETPSTDWHFGDKFPITLS